MRMAEPHDRAIFLVIARAGVPAMGVRIGAQLRHAERQRRAGTGMAVAAGADEEIGLAAGKRAALAHGTRAARGDAPAERNPAGGAPNGPAHRRDPPPPPTPS